MVAEEIGDARVNWRSIGMIRHVVSKKGAEKSASESASERVMNE